MAEEKMTAAEIAAEKTRKADLAAQIGRMDDVELGLLAKRAEVDATQYPKREDLVAAIELKAEVDAAAGRQAVRDMEDQEAASVASEDLRRPAMNRIIRALNTEFCSNIPPEARHGGFEPDEDHPRFGGDYDVPNGKYRVVGSEWLFVIRKKKLFSAERASEGNKYGGPNVIGID